MSDDSATDRGSDDGPSDSGHADYELYDALDGQTALVTGATRGIGAAIAARLLDCGATVYAGARNVDDVPDDATRPIELDVLVGAHLRTAIDRIEREAGRLDVLVNNAGHIPPHLPLHKASVEDIERTLATNLRGPLVVTKHALPLLLDRPGGRVVNVSSGDGAFEDVEDGYEGVAGHGYPSYRVSKAGLNGFTAYLDGEYGERGLIANAVCPGAVQTEGRAERGSPPVDRTPAEGAETPAFLARFRPGSSAGSFWRDREIIPW